MNKLNFYSYFVRSFICINICLLGCGNENSPYDKSSSLDGFSDAVPLGELTEDQKKVAIKNNELALPVAVAEKGIKLDDSLPSEQKVNSNLLNTLPDSPPKANLPSEIAVLKKILSSSSKIIQITEDLEFSPLIIERYKIFQISNGLEKVLIDQQKYSSIFKESMPAISKVLQTISQGLWVGFTNGEIITFKDNIWSKRIGGPATKKVSIKDFIETNKGIFVASKGIYQWDEKFDKFMSSDALKNEFITDIKLVDEENLVFTTPSSIRLLSLLDKTSKTIYHSFTGDYPITNLFISKNRIEIAGKQGILSLSKNGFPLSRTGTSISVRQICNIDEGKGFIISSSGDLIGFDNQETFHVNNVYLQNVSNCFLNSNNEILLTIENSNLYKGDKLSFFEFLKNNQKVDTSEFNKVYLNACLAAEDLIKGRIYSKQISSPVIDGERHVFFNGIQACPNRKGFMRADGLTITVDKSNNLNLFEYNSRKALSYPERTDSSKVTKLFIDSNKNIYLGTEDGLFISNGKSWKSPENSELKSDHITDILEDSRGNIWISTRIKKSSSQDQNQDYNALHVKTFNDTWAHFGKSSGVNTLGISSLDFRNNTLYFGAPYGFSKILPNSLIQTFSKVQGVQNFIVENINLDSKERVWLAHSFFQNGVSWIDDKNYYLTDQTLGLFSNRIVSSSEDDGERIWLMDSSGEVGVYSYNYLIKISKSTDFYPERAVKVEFKP